MNIPMFYRYPHPARRGYRNVRGKYTHYTPFFFPFHHIFDSGNLFFISNMLYTYLAIYYNN